MLGRVLFFGVVAATRVVAQQPDTTTYSSAALRTIVVRAVELNRAVPPGLGRYTSHVETEFTMGVRTRDARDIELSMEQAASTLTWDRTGEAEQRIIGYRAPQSPVGLLSLGIVNRSWVVPALYGNRLDVFFGHDSARAPRGADPPPRDTLRLVHPLAVDRERYYTFRGGDTTVTLNIGGRDIPIVRVDVTPRENLVGPAEVFSGELDIDATRYHLVRMRGTFLRIDRHDAAATLGALGLHVVAFVEFVNAEVDGRWWLPQSQRIELQVSDAAFGDGRYAYRALSTFSDYHVTPPPDSATGDSLRAAPHKLSRAPRDTLDQFKDWNSDLGHATTLVTGADFDDIGPDFLRSTGPPRVALQTERFEDWFHMDRIEGPFTGTGVTVRFRDAAPGLTLRAAGGYAWSERTIRGRAVVEWSRSGTTLGLRAGRSLDVTNDFRPSTDSGPSLGIFRHDDYDYVDRRSATAQVTRAFDARRLYVARLDAGVADDRAPAVHWRYGHPGDRTYDNRGVVSGSYAKTALTLSRNENVVDAFGVRPGFGGRVYYERGDGALNYQRVEVRAAVRLLRGPFTLRLEADGGALFSRDPPPQQLFEVGGGLGLPGYDYKQFAGDRAGLASIGVHYRLPFLRAPIPIPLWRGRTWLLDPAPSLAAGFQTGRADATTDATRSAIVALGGICTPLGPPCTTASQPSDGWRGSFAAGFEMFGGLSLAMIARSTQRPVWRVVYLAGF